MRNTAFIPKRLAALAGIVLFGLPLIAQTDTWEKGGSASLTFSQFAADKWQGAPDNSLNGITFLNLFANYKKDSTLTWENTFDFNYGIQKINGGSPGKTEDKIELNSKFGKAISKKMFISGLLNFKTQVADGKQDESGNYVSRPFAPAYLTLSLGIDYKPNKNLSLLLAPVAGKATFVTDDSLSAQGAYGVEVNETSRFEFGGSVTAAFVYPIVENVNLALKSTFFSNYIDNPTSIDVDAELKLDMKINEFLSTSFIANMKYDEDIPVMIGGEQVKSLTQWKEVFGLAVMYKF